MSQQVNWKQGDLIEVEIQDMTDQGDGVGKGESGVVFIPNTVVGDRLITRLVKAKSNYANGQIYELLSPSEHRTRPSCIVADKCGGCQWQHILDDYQLELKENQVLQALERIGKFENLSISPILFTQDRLGYRNKVTYPLAKSKNEQVQAGYYQKGSHKVVNLNQCPIQDKRLNNLLEGIKKDIQLQNWSIYDETTQKGQLRHLSFRIGRKTGEILATLISTKPKLFNLKQQAEVWLSRYPQLVGVCLNIQPQKNNVIFGEKTHRIAGHSFIHEEFLGLKFQLSSDTFFQVNTEMAEKLVTTIIEELQLTGNETVIDAYCGIGTFTLPLAQKVKKVIGIEVYQGSIEQAQTNASNNYINNVDWYTGEVAKVLPELEVKPDIIVLDPPRQGCDAVSLQHILDLSPKTIVYVSCKPSTLARDLHILCQENQYQIKMIQPADFFPQTAHVECAVILTHQHKK